MTWKVGAYGNVQGLGFRINLLANKNNTRSNNSTSDNNNNDNDNSEPWFRASWEISSSGLKVARLF